MFERVRRVIRKIHPTEPSFTEDGRDKASTIVRLAALLHDGGDAPFSHPAEDVMPQIAGQKRRYDHEDDSSAIIKHFFQGVINRHPENVHGVTADEICAFLGNDGLPAQFLFWRELLCVTSSGATSIQSSWIPGAPSAAGPSLSSNGFQLACSSVTATPPAHSLSWPRLRPCSLPPHSLLARDADTLRDAIPQEDRVVHRPGHRRSRPAANAATVPTPVSARARNCLPRFVPFTCPFTGPKLRLIAPASIFSVVPSGICNLWKRIPTKPDRPVLCKSPSALMPPTRWLPKSATGAVPASWHSMDRGTVALSIPLGVAAPARRNQSQSWGAMRR